MLAAVSPNIETLGLDRDRARTVLAKQFGKR
jgi:hypothetical protein